MLALVGVRYGSEGEENLDLQHPTICMFSHLSNLDPFVLCAGSPIACKGVSVH